MTDFEFDWSDLAFASKKPLSSLKATFIAAPRKMSQKRLTQLVKTYLPKGPIIFGIAKEKYIDGFESQTQFETLQPSDITDIVAKVNTSNSPNKLYVLHCFQRELPFVIEKIARKRAVFVNGSWKHLFHTRPLFYTLVKNHLPYELVTPFCDEQEAKAYADDFAVQLPKPGGSHTAKEMLQLASEAATMSFDNGFQTGVTLGQKEGGKYTLISSSFNEVVPYQTYAMHHGASRETNFSPMHDLNHYDTIHAEVALIIDAQKRGLDLSGTTLFINLLPCPSCARMFTKTDIAEFVYREDHSDGYGVKLLELAGKKVTRIV
jgi:deoxycytidylate deaminase